jgi:Flp pilus assembly protein TadD
LGGCAKKAEGPAPRYAVVRFENLSGDPGLEWTARGASELLPATLAGALDGPIISPASLVRLSSTLGLRPGGAPGISSEKTAAQLAGANRMITGYIERTAAGVRATGTEEDLGTQKVVRTVSVVERSPLKALNELARALSPKAGPYQTSSEEAFRLYCIGREATEPEIALTSLAQAVRADANFGPAWRSLIEVTLASGNRQEAESLIAKAREQKTDRLTLANLDFESAVLRGDQKARLAALKQVSLLSPTDTILLRTLAETEAAAGQFAEAAADWRRLRDILPADPDAWNQLGYALAWGGNYPEAVRTMEGYARLRPGDPNPPDSLGDVHFMYRKFKEAAASYQKAYALSPGFENGGDLYKAAWAKFMAGDKAGADASFAQFRKAQEKNDNFFLIAADWLYGTGRQKEAVAELRGKMETASAVAKPAALQQLAVWELLAGDRTSAARDAEAAGPPATPAGFLVRFATLPSAPAAEWEVRAARMVTAPAAVALRRLAVGYALLLDGKKEAALPVWKEIAETTPANDFALRTVYARLRGEQPKMTAAPNPGSVNPFASVAEKL